MSNALLRSNPGGFVNGDRKRDTNTQMKMSQYLRLDLKLSKLSSITELIAITSPNHARLSLHDAKSPHMAFPSGTSASQDEHFRYNCQ